MKTRCLKFQTRSDKETIELGRKIGALLSTGDVIALIGPLGSGKTWLTKGIALGLGVDPSMVVTSPSFSLVNEYNAGNPLYHMDLYRLESVSDILAAGLEEYIYKDGVAVVEWADRMPEILPEWSITLSFNILDDHSREIIIMGGHKRAADIINQLESYRNC
ncbi:MAG: tRNA (adenosine(37)-N6)-threonylcarbamoyltransferase complex ATPase subunit type 1 TsaE [Deltaproteobacteria bacterium]|nr:tRNA (adenosine(37)-N6)-threonylcarbamoyltransferase complex ATPase subunit type 1 TsaE [Deltaproteobacteria bacterium]